MHDCENDKGMAQNLSLCEKRFGRLVKKGVFLFVQISDLWDKRCALKQKKYPIP